MLSRRDFLKLSGLTLGSLFINLYPSWPINIADSGPIPGNLRGRITRSGVNIYSEPNFKSPIIGALIRDQLINILKEEFSPEGPVHNPRWYLTEPGYIFSGWVQRVDHAHLNPIQKHIIPTGQLAEITVPFVQSHLLTRTNRLKPLYRLYYGSVYWIIGIILNSQGQYCYILKDDLLGVKLVVPANSLRPISPEELSPISPEIPDVEKTILVSLANQTLTCFERKEIVFLTKISSGIPTRNPRPDYVTTDTPTGTFYIQSKHPSRHMGDGELTSKLDAYELPGVPWVSFFHKLGYGFHGTYWHDNFGKPMSHGCINMCNEDALWLYRWSKPSATHHEWFLRGLGTKVEIKT